MTPRWELKSGDKEKILGLSFGYNFEELLFVGRDYSVRKAQPFVTVSKLR